MLRKLLSPFLQLLSNFSSNLPQTIDEFDLFYQDLVTLFDLPSGNQTKHAVASLIMQLDPLTTKKPKKYFGRAITKSIINQAAFQTLKKIREEDEQKAKDEQAASSETPTLPQ